MPVAACRWWPPRGPSDRRGRGSQCGVPGAGEPGWRVYVERRATEAFWDERWAIDEAELAAMLAEPGPSYTVPVTRRHLRPEDGRVLEGGCGRGQHVAALRRAGYDCVGLDSAPRIVAAIQKVAPHVPVELGDVRRLPFADGSFAGYWSIGVIEHFFAGYDDIVAEAARVLRPGGVLFLVFPHLSPARRLRGRLGGYPPAGPGEPDGFYQFALDPGRVRARVEAAGFVLCTQTPRGGLIGLKEELGRAGLALDPLLRARGRAPRLVRGAFNRALAPIMGHSVLQVYRKQARGRPR